MLMPAILLLMMIAGMAANANIHIAVSNAISIADAIAIATSISTPPLSMHLLLPAIASDIVIANSSAAIHAGCYNITANAASAIEAIAIDIEHKTIISTTPLEQGYIYHATYLAGEP
jgi:hypothetical protein